VSQLRDDIRMTYDGVVVLPNGGYAHPNVIRDWLGEDAYIDLLSRPRIASEYDGCDCPSCQRADAEESNEPVS
jgi:hypothetical protein